jgi:hypothetical protein
MELPEEIREYLSMVIAEDVDRNEDHITWLARNPIEPDRTLQIAECERAIELGGKAQEFFPPRLFPMPSRDRKRAPNPEAKSRFVWPAPVGGRAFVSVP